MTTQLPHSLKATVEQIKDDQVELSTETGHRLMWPRERLADIQVGETIELVALSKHDIESERAMLAKQVLNYMLSGDKGAL
jgi:hypothetical protein